METFLQTLPVELRFIDSPATASCAVIRPEKDSDSMIGLRADTDALPFRASVAWKSAIDTVLTTTVTPLVCLP